MRLSKKQLTSLKVILRELYGLELADEQVQEAGMAIIRFVIAKARRKQLLTKNEVKNHD